MTHPRPASGVPVDDLSDFYFMENVVIHAVAQQRVELIPKLIELYLESHKQENNQ